MSSTGYASLAGNQADYERLALSSTGIEPWEDGQREATGPGHYEWWYFDAHLDDGSSIVIVFYTKFAANAAGPFAPLVTVEITRADGKTIERRLPFAPDAFEASKDGCDVRIGNNRFRGNLEHYIIDVESDGLAISIDLTSEIPAWRPRTGHFLFVAGGEPEEVFAWLPAVPQGKVKATYTLDGEHVEATGTGYHDHNWGDTPMPALIHDWYWARAQVGPFTVVASYIVPVERFGVEPVIVFLLAKDGRIVCDDETRVRFEIGDVFTDEKTGKPIANVIRFTYQDDAGDYVITFTRETSILQSRFVDRLPPVEQAAAIKAGVDSAYHRFTGSAAVERRENGQVVEHHENQALWELMYLGHAADGVACRLSHLPQLADFPSKIIQQVHA